MSKNVVFMVNLSEKQKPGRNTPYQYSRNSWKKYCDRHDLNLFVLEQRIHDENYMNANWHKLFVFKLLEANDIDYNKVLIVDSDTIVHPDAPNIFDECGDGICMVHNEGSYDWLLRSMETYSTYLFEGFTFPFYEYCNSGVMVANKKHKDFFNGILDFYDNNHDRIKQIQNTFHVGTDQPVINFFIHRDRDDLQILPYEWNMQDLTRREILDMNLTFTKYGWVYHFNAIPSNFKINPNKLLTPVYQWMRYTYEKLYGEENV